MLVHFIDAAHHSSVRTLPYLEAWHHSYAEHGLTVLGVNSPRFPFTGEEAKLAAMLERSGVSFPVALDREYRVWHDYGCHGWPSLFLWGEGGALRWFHFGEGEYGATEELIRELLRERDALRDLPPPMEPIRPTDAPGALVMPPSEEVFPGGSMTEPLVAAKGVPVEIDYAAGGAYATVDGEGELAVSLDGSRDRAIRVSGPGLYELVAHERHERHRLALTPSRGVTLYGVSFAAGLP